VAYLAEGQGLVGLALGEASLGKFFVTVNLVTINIMSRKLSRRVIKTTVRFVEKV